MNMNNKIEDALKEIMHKDSVQITCCAVIDGEEITISALECSYLQMQCSNAPNFKEFCNRVQIYDGSDTSYPQMIFLPSGRFEDEFKNVKLYYNIEFITELCSTEDNITKYFNLY